MDEDEICCVFDPSHLMKNWKTHLMNYDFIVSDEDVKEHNLPSNLVKFSHIRGVALFQVNVYFEEISYCHYKFAHGRVAKVECLQPTLYKVFTFFIILSQFYIKLLCRPHSGT